LSLSIKVVAKLQNRRLNSHSDLPTFISLTVRRFIIDLNDFQQIVVILNI
jgi:hypothetical protein